MLDTTARRLGIPLSPQYQVTEGQRFGLGPNVPVPDVSVWAFEAPVGETSPVIEAPSGYYVFRLDSVTVSGVPPLAQIKGQVIAAVRLEKQKALGLLRADSLATFRHGLPNLACAAAAPI